MELLYHAMHFDASDPRDNIYALLGCSRNSSIGSFTADYRLSSKEAINRVAPLLYLEHGNLDSLHCAQYEGDIPG